MKAFSILQSGRYILVMLYGHCAVRLYAPFELVTLGFFVPGLATSVGVFFYLGCGKMLPPMRFDPA